MGSTFTFLKHVPPELFLEYIIPCLHPVEVKSLMQTCKLYHKIGKSQMYKHFIYCLNSRLNKLHPALLLQQLDSFNADYHPEIHNRVVYGDLLLEVYTGRPQESTIQSYRYTIGFWINHREASPIGIPRSVIFVQEKLPKSEGELYFQLFSSVSGTFIASGYVEYQTRRRLWIADRIGVSSSGLQIHKDIRFVTESMISKDPLPLSADIVTQMSYVGLRTPYLSGSTLVVPSTLNSGTKED